MERRRVGLEGMSSKRWIQKGIRDHAASKSYKFIFIGLFYLCGKVSSEEAMLLSRLSNFTYLRVVISIPSWCSLGVLPYLLKL